ncbi:histidine kinase [Microbacterium sp. W1N]|uniref:histidine kinase n=1 Tax=Microbacterium festucae TaxID=2977531 RepID=UPI0021C15E00|nr:histidine kinase [Microbacterium festucae]MCT9818714.1 histidine kinase [Microbacterium festucae]
MTLSPVARAAAILLGLEGIGLLVLAGWELVALIGGDTVDPTSSLALLVLTVVGAVVVIALAVGVFRGASWGRSGGIVTQLLVLAVALGAATGPEGDAARAALIAAPALVTGVLLLLAARAAAPPRPRD